MAPHSHDSKESKLLASRNKEEGKIIQKVIQDNRQIIAIMSKDIDEKQQLIRHLMLLNILFSFCLRNNDK